MISIPTFMPRLYIWNMDKCDPIITTFNEDEELTFRVHTYNGSLITNLYGMDFYTIL